jgi:hypothetical protein
VANPSKQKGTGGENEAVALMRRWFKAAERRALKGSLDSGDVAGTPFVVSVKRCETFAIHSWLKDLHKMRLNASFGADEPSPLPPGFILARRNRSEWVAIMPASVLSELLDQIYGGSDAR